jgi:molecular chaperone DnaK (HSP70)
LWRAGESIPLANVIADHVTSFLPEGIRDIVLAIPNDLHEFGQQALISALKRRGCKPTLLWRPVAAAISWCNRLPAVETKAMIEKDDSLIVIHLGADNFEFVPLKLRKIERNGIKYVVPLRTRPRQRAP